MTDCILTTQEVIWGAPCGGGREAGKAGDSSLSAIVCKEESPALTAWVGRGRGEELHTDNAVSNKNYFIVDFLPLSVPNHVASSNHCNDVLLHHHVGPGAADLLILAV